MATNSNGTGVRWVLGIVMTLLIIGATTLIAHMQLPAHPVSAERATRFQEDIAKISGKVEVIGDIVLLNSAALDRIEKKLDK